MTTVASTADRGSASEALAFLGVAIDTSRNDTGTRDRDITATGAAVQTLVISAREDLQIAREARQLLGAQNAGSAAPTSPAGNGCR